ncbi:hypothetical protein HA514_15145 [Enterobacter kobei]|uniref:hypothetical protein n=1 Tax=Enterobacter kobei TaxID=208224 RepID=UPI00140F85FB|nr:hypothetical protein [Enterobacter kobei]QIP20869.1 hypothetical protein HA514_15145 [Enterobacter kobei]
MKTQITLIALLFAVAALTAHAISSHYREQLARSGCTEMNASDGTCDIHKSKAQNQAQQSSADIHDPLREASFSSDALNATISNGFFSATINGKKATIKRVNANFYEIHGGGFVISLSLDENGIIGASWNKTKGRDHGILQVKQ